MGCFIRIDIISNRDVSNINDTREKCLSEVRKQKSLKEEGCVTRDNSEMSVGEILIPINFAAAFLCLIAMVQ